MSRPLIVALHGVGSSGRDMGAALAPLAPVADVIALDGCEAFDGGGAGRQWFSLSGVTQADRPRRVANALPRMIQRLDQLAQDHGVAREDLVLLGFSQGAIMTLAMVAQGLHAGRVIAIAGRLAAPVIAAGARAASLLVIGDSADPVMPFGLSQDAAERLRAAGHHVDLRLTDGIGHGVGSQTLSSIASWLPATAVPRANALTTEG
ncbi:phospholipase/carboxylesterase [Novosphingobium sp. CF614]|uniref:alpha/beta hydrolase n=1 Tax=Novosphingobium sp. CF614 TaxID=1884364 RepID=UPI0008DFA6FF|nr:dienelactone hydrolase family protein [Novosphingobium sp. CF614]SFG45110.1 phospholipase/carboxylesterase [Novosphingobium sp. CF614]